MVRREVAMAVSQTGLCQCGLCKLYVTIYSFHRPLPRVNLTSISAWDKGFLKGFQGVSELKSSLEVLTV